MGETFLEAVARLKCRTLIPTVASSAVEWRIGTENGESG